MMGAPESVFSSHFPPPPFGEKPKYVQSLPQKGPNVLSPFYLLLLPQGVQGFKQAAIGLQACISPSPVPALLSCLLSHGSLLLDN